MFDNKIVLVTGGSGSFGNHFVRTLLDKYDLKKLIIYSRDELKQFEMSLDLPKHKSELVQFFIGDVRDLDRLKTACRGVDYIVHAAALKQVPATEHNPIECIKTNIHGAENIIQASIAADVDKVIALSTDKAANPINLYGATKLASDKLFVTANNITGGHKTKFSVVRYGNVVGSRGSVLPYFLKLHNNKSGYFPITDDRMTRFWISLQQGVDFVLKNFSRMQGGEVFVPKIPSIRIVDLAESIDPNYHREVIGIRPGEKLHETMCPRDDYHLTLDFADHFVIKPSIMIGKGDINYKKNMLGETGSEVVENFEYHSGNNPHFLSVEEISAFHHGLGYY